MDKYQCPECGWIGEESEMESDYCYEDERDNIFGEYWSNWICPSCYTWQDLENYKKINIG